MCYLVDEKQMGKKVMNKILGSNMTDVTSWGVCVGCNTHENITT